MNREEINPARWNPSNLFYLGFAAVMLSLWLPFVPGWHTFIHMWRVELAASIFLLFTLAYLYYRHPFAGVRSNLSKEERTFVIFPIIAFILWSLLSAAWAPSWKSAMHHSLVWIEYLIFFFIARHLLDEGYNGRKLLKVFVITLVLYALPAIFEYCAFLVFGGGSTLGMRYAKFGEQVITILPLAMVAVLRLTRRQFQIGLAAITAMWLLIFCSFGRINIFLFACGVASVALVIFTFPRFHRYRVRVSIAAVVFLAAPLPLHIFSLASVDPNVPIVRRLEDADGLSGSNNFRKLMYSISLQMLEAHPIVGVGADNFGMQVNNYRVEYAAVHPDDPNLAFAENEIPEHAHNEFLQIAAELGVVGSLIFLWFFSGIVVMTYRALRNLRRRSLYPIAAILGLWAFICSSLVSAYSFRLIQNGFVFFFVLAVASKLLLRRDNSGSERVQAIVSPAQYRLACAAGIAACLLLLAYSTVRVASVVTATRANYKADLDEAAPLYARAMSLDNENPDARNDFGMRLFQQRRFAEAVPYLAAAIKIGKAPSCDFSYLATAQSLAGDNVAAEQTMAAAASLYPRSAFALTRYASLLRENGRDAESATQFARAVQVNRPAANTWWAMMNKGPRAASELAFKFKDDYTEVMNLQPQSSIYAVAAERDIRFPGESFKFQF